MVSVNEAEGLEEAPLPRCSLSIHHMMAGA